MKVRNDFVTNSSSSSFILAFKSKEDGAAKIAAMSSEYGSKYVTALLTDFMAATPISAESFAEQVKDDVECEAYYAMSIGEGGWWSSSKPTFENLWRKNHHGASHMDYYESKEYKEELERRMKEIMDELTAKISENPYVVALEYEDHSDTGSTLEHEILPGWEHTVRRFSHH